MLSDLGDGQDRSLGSSCVGVGLQAWRRGTRRKRYVPLGKPFRGQGAWWAESVKAWEVAVIIPVSS